MRNLKKILALVLALVMSMSLLATANAFNDDAEIDPTYDEAVTVLANLGVFQGYNNGETFVPKGSITRAEVAAILYRIATGDVDDTQVGLYADYNKFSDVKSTSWYAGYVNYCANAEYIKGYDDKTFGPNDPVTGYQALAMILRAVGYDVNNEFTGTSWQVKVASTANQLGLTRNVSAGTLSTAATREVVAEVLFRTIAEAYVVEWTTAFGYQPVFLPGSVIQGPNTPLFGGFSFATLGGQTFGLELTEGEITAVGRTAGTTTLIPDPDSVAANGTPLTTRVTVTGTNTPWTDIGYAAYVYTVPTAGAKTRAAVSDLVVTGESLAVNTAKTDGLTIEPLISTVAGNKTAQIVSLQPGTGVNREFDGNVYYNGMLLERSYSPSVNNGYWWDQDHWVVVHGNNNVEVVNGLKVDFIDNDNGGLAETIVFTEYTAGQLVGIATDSNTGTNAYVTDTYYFDVWSKANDTANHESKIANTVCADTLAYGDVVTYVVYAGDTYVTKAPVATGTFTQINYSALNTATDISYVIGDKTYVKANNEDTELGYVQDYFYGFDSLLEQGAIKKNLAVYTDPHGYMFYVTEVLPEANYLFVVWNEDTEVRPGTTGITAVYPDGTVADIDIARVVDADDYTISDTDWNFTRNEIERHIYNNNSSVLTYVCGNAAKADGHYTGSYTKGNTKLEDGAYFTSASVVVDIRGVIARTATSGTVYTGYSEIPSLNAAEFHYVTDASGFITLAYITAGTELDNKEFVVYHTQFNSYGVSGGNLLYTLSVIEDGALTTVTLDQDQYDAIKYYGVGVYSFDRYGDLVEYTSFAEEWYDVRWANNTIVLEDKTTGDDVASYGYNNAKFWVLDIETNKAEGAAYGYTMAYGQDVQAYVVGAGTSATEIYIIKGKLATGTVNAYQPKDNGVWSYIVADGYVTAATWSATKTAAPTVTIAGNTIAWTKSGNTYSATIPYATWKNWVDKDIKVEAAAGNQIAIRNEVSFSTKDQYVDVTATEAGKTADQTQNVVVYSQSLAAAQTTTQYTYKITYEKASADATLTAVTATYPNAIINVAGDKIGYKGNGSVTGIELTSSFVPTAKYATVEWTIVDASTGATYEYDYSWVNGVKGEVSKNTIPADFKTDAADVIEVKVTAENGTATKTYKLGNFFILTVESFAEETTIKDKITGTVITSGSYVAEGTVLTFQWKVDSTDGRSYGSTYHTCVNGISPYIVDGSALTSGVADGTYEFTMPSANAAINTHTASHT